MAELTYRDAVAAGIAQEMARDDRVVFLGEDVAAAGGVFKTDLGRTVTIGSVIGVAASSPWFSLTSTRYCWLAPRTSGPEKSGIMEHAISSSAGFERPSSRFCLCTRL